MGRFRRLQVPSNDQSRSLGEAGESLGAQIWPPAPVTWFLSGLTASVRKFHRYETGRIVSWDGRGACAPISRTCDPAPDSSGSPARSRSSETPASARGRSRTRCTRSALAGEVFGGQPPEAHHRNLHLGAPREHVRGLVGPQLVPLEIRESGMPGVASVPVLDEPEMPRDAHPSYRLRASMGSRREALRAG